MGEARKRKQLTEKKVKRFLHLLELIGEKESNKKAMTFVKNRFGGGNKSCHAVR